MNATSVPIAAAAQPSNEGISMERFEEILDQSYDVTNRSGVVVSGDNKRGEMLFFRDGFVHCGA